VEELRGRIAFGKIYSGKVKVGDAAACLHGRLGGVLLLDPLAEFGGLATAAKPIWPHDAYFPGILGAADLPEALALQPAPGARVRFRILKNKAAASFACGELRWTGAKGFAERP